MGKLFGIGGGISIALVLSVAIWMLKGSRFVGLEDQVLPLFMLLGALIAAFGGGALFRRFEAALVGFLIGPVVTAIGWQLLKTYAQASAQLQQ